MLTPVLVVVALAASALGSPSGALQRGPEVSYTVQVTKGGSYVGPAALISEDFAVCAAHLVKGLSPSSLRVKAGTPLNFPFNPFGQTVGVLAVLVHPDAELGSDVAVLQLAKRITNKSVLTIPVADEEPSSGSLAVVSGWSSWLSLSVAVDEEWLVLPRYCHASSTAALCATGSLRSGAVLVVDGRLVGLATGSGSGSGKDLVSYVSLGEASVKKFIAAATGLAPTEQPTEEPTELPTEKPTERPTQRPTEKPTQRPTQRPTEKPSTAPAPATTVQPTEAPSDKSTANPSGKKCTIRVNGGLPTGEPILLQPDQLAFRDPDTADAVVLAAGESLRLACSGSSNAFKQYKTESVLTAQCIEDTSFRVNGKSVELSQLGCKTVAYNEARASGTCGDQNQYKLIRIGFAVKDDFVTLIENCFDGRTFDAVYSRSQMTPAIAGHESGVKRPSFSPGSFYENINPNSLYVRKNQRSAVAQLLGDSDLAAKYITDDQTHFLARGHLSAKADYILGAQQRATFYYVNVAPQWQTFNGDNWEKLESSVRDYVVSSGRTVEVVTGTWGVATLPNKDGVETELYLHADKHYIRVPKYYWKIVYDVATKEAVALVGLNNPYHTLTDADVLCEDICSRYSWLEWNAASQASGNGFCCDVNELRKVVTTIPADLDVQSVL